MYAVFQLQYRETNLDLQNWLRYWDSCRKYACAMYASLGKVEGYKTIFY